MNRFVIEFTKQGYIKYISHLDMLRLFKRVFKKAGIPLDYSKGFNPHPRMSFAQPLSLGYTSKQEFIEFFTYEDISRDEILIRLTGTLPVGIEIIKCGGIQQESGSIAACVESAQYTVTLPLSSAIYEDRIKGDVYAYLNQESIKAMKRMKKTKRLGEVEIRDKIRNMKVVDYLGSLNLIMDLDCGSSSNLSPELVITTFLQFSRLDIERYDIEVSRDFMRFNPCIPQTIGIDFIYQK